MPEPTKKEVDKSAFEAEQVLLSSLDKSFAFLESTDSRLKQVEEKVFAIFNAELDEFKLDADGKKVYTMTAMNATQAYRNITDSAMKWHKLKLDTITVLQGVRKNWDAEVGDEIIDSQDTSDLPEHVKRGMVKAMSQYLRGAQTMPHRKNNRGQKPKQPK